MREKTPSSSKTEGSEDLAGVEVKTSTREYWMGDPRPESVMRHRWRFRLGVTKPESGGFPPAEL